MEEVRAILPVLATLVAVFSLAVSAFSVWISTRNWRQSNRPIVVASVRTNQAGNVAIAYDLVVVNAGTRPATRVRLHCDPARLRAAQTEVKPKPLFEHIKRCFDPSRSIPLLLHGNSVSSSFGMTSSEPEQATWRPGAEIPIEITYSDLEGRSYRSKLELVIRDSDALAGGSWGSKSPGAR